MGTWKLPDGEQEMKDLKQYYKELKVLESKITDIFGDDILLDGFAIAIERLAEIATHLTPSCKHPAFYTTDKGEEVPGICAHCRLYLDEEST